MVNTKNAPKINIPRITGMAAALSFVICFIMTSVMADAGQSEFEKIYAAAEKARMKADSVGSEWRDTAMILEQSKAAADSGDYAQAITLATQAKQQGELGYAQAQANDEFRKSVPFYDADASPEEDLKKLQVFFFRKFPELPREEFGNGFYALDAIMRENWEAIEEFPPYEPSIDDGEALWNTPFANGKTYKSCFGASDVANQYPQWDRKRKEVVTLPYAVNLCRETNKEAPLDYKSAEMLSVTAYIAFQSRGKPTNVVVPKDDPEALAAYKQGKDFYFARRGQLNMACFQCHFNNSGQKIRTNVLGTAVGQTTHWPAYRSKWNSMGGLHRRYSGCNKQVRAKPHEQQSDVYRNLEFFHTYMSNSIPLNGPGARF